MNTATDKSTIQLVLVAVAIITFSLFAFAGACILLDKAETAVTPLFTAGGLGLGGLLATLNNTRTAQGAVVVDQAVVDPIPPVV